MTDFTSSIRPYGRGDMDKITARRDFAALMNEDHFGRFGPADETTWSLVRDKWFVHACGGYVEERHGVYTLWGLCGADLTRREWILIAHKTREIIQSLFDMGAHRVHALARADHASAITFLMHIGLSQDINRLVAVGPEGEDFYLLAKIKGRP